MNYLRYARNLSISRRFHVYNARYAKKTTSTIAENKSNETLSQNLVSSKIDFNLLPPKTTIDAKTIALLERLSLVDCANKQSIKVLEDAIEFADQIFQIDTTGIQPLVTVLEDRPLELREDIVTEKSYKARKDILLNASVTEEEYFVAPPGNIPLEPRENLLYEEKDTKSN